MEKLVTYTGLLLVGVVLGWWLRDTAPGGASLLQRAAPTASFSLPAAALPSRVALPSKENAVASAVSQQTDSADAPAAARFAQLLAEHEFEQAVSYYEQALAIGERYQRRLRPLLEDFLSVHVAQCTNGTFVDLVDQWLASYYQDIPVLLLLAENQRLCSSPEEAASTLQIARTYALTPASHNAVTAAVAQLIATTDENLSQQEDWVALLGFLEFLQAVDLFTNDSELRRAGLYQLMGEGRRGQELLLALREKDDGTDAQWTAALNQQWGESTPATSLADIPAQGIPLVRRGDHFLISTLIGGASRVLLMIDTGASVTILTKRRFEQLNGSEFEYQGARLFSTANGMAQGEVYQTGSITLGNTRLNGPEIAVLDYESSGGVDGLLGMNVLRHYRFQIDQDKELLYLRPR